ncbi:hypothetical protein KZ483_04775 [Paenibacillus sp. sptzw28]|uniref:hypothetical protein n=1 Tax=Paenibacillus sp. sptzw28 TaxID=715179 RepID=UPI001C6F55C2|nr:hypothetical protein [Paenibacillus sp. sptzw28]QYR22311.1 hypothetical protein KZ483_04775 [Paenibacillus sp. sptzw28]
MALEMYRQSANNARSMPRSTRRLMRESACANRIRVRDPYADQLVTSLPVHIGEYAADVGFFNHRSGSTHTESLASGQRSG